MHEDKVYIQHKNNESNNLELEVAEEMLKKAHEMMKERDRENAWLNDMLSQHVEKIQVKHRLMRSGQSLLDLK